MGAYFTGAERNRKSEKKPKKMNTKEIGDRCRRRDVAVSSATKKARGPLTGRDKRETKKQVLTFKKRISRCVRAGRCSNAEFLSRALGVLMAPRCATG